MEETGNTANFAQKTASMMTTILPQKLDWTEADLEQYGFDIWAGCYKIFFDDHGKSKTEPIGIESVVDNIIREMERAKRTQAKQISNANPAVKTISPSITPKTTTITKQVSWTEDDLEKFGFDIWEGCYSILFQTENKQCVINQTINFLLHKSEIKTHWQYEHLVTD